MIRRLARVVVQLTMVAPMVTYYPFAVLIAGSGIYMLLMGRLKPDEFIMLPKFILGAIGLTALFASIALSDATSRRTLTRRLLTIGLVCGVVATLWMLLIDYGGLTRSLLSWFTVHLHGGPLVVAAWNIWRMWRAIESPRTPDAGASQLV